MQASTNRNQMIKIFINEITLALVKQMPNQDSHRVHYDQLKASLEKDGQPQSVHELIANISQMEAGTTFFIWGKEPKRILKFISDNLINISAAGGLVQNPSGEVLFIKRKGKWDLPKGKPEKKEDNRTTAIREVEEECGISGLNIIAPLPSTYHIYKLPSDDFVLKKSYWFHMKVANWQNPQPQTEEEITEAVWITMPVPQKILLGAYLSIAELIRWFSDNQ